jgi:hypothetical protein
VDPKEASIQDHNYERKPIDEASRELLRKRFSFLVGSNSSEPRACKEKIDIEERQAAALG